MTSRSRLRLVKEAVTIALGFLGITTGYWAADQVDLVWVFWLVIVLALILATGRYLIGVLRPKVLLLIHQVRLGQQYAGLLERTAKWQARAFAAEAQVELSNSAAEASAEELVLEGRRRVLAEIDAIGSKAVVTLSAMGVEDGEVVLVGELGDQNQPPVGSRWLLKVGPLRQSKAVVRVREVQKANVFFVLDEVHDETYVVSLIKAASEATAIPSALKVVPRTVESLTELLKEGRE